MLRATVLRILHKRLNLQAYKVQMLQASQQDDLPYLLNFAMEMLQCIDSDADFLLRLLYTDETTFNLSGNINYHNMKYGDRKIRIILVK